MTNIAATSSISLIFNDSWIAHMGSRIYRTAIELIELLGTTFSYPLVQPYSGKRLYQLVDTYRESINNKEQYNQARSTYAASIITALQGEKNIFKKIERVRTILNTHIIGLSILQVTDKKALSEHVAYTLLPSLIDEFGALMANRSILALHELDNIAEKNLNEYAKLYKDITLQQSDLDSFAGALQRLNSDVSQDILIHELLLSRNRNLSQPAKNKIITILEDRHYIDIKLQKKLQLIDQLKSQNKGKEFSENEITLELQSHREAQLKAIRYIGPSMFFDSIDNSENSSENSTDSSKDVFLNCIDNTEDVFLDCIEPLEEAAAYPETAVQPTKAFLSSEMPVAIANTHTDSSEDAFLDYIEPLEEAAAYPETAVQPTKAFLSSEMPVAIANTHQNCWYNSALQILGNTPIYSDIFQQSEKFSKDLPAISASFNLYRHIYCKNSDIRKLRNPSKYGINTELTKDIEEIYKGDPNLLQEVQSYRKNRVFKPLNLNDQMPAIRIEAHNSLGQEFRQSGAKQEDSKYFLNFLLEKLSIDVARAPLTPESDIFSLGNKHLLIDTDPSQKVDLKTLFADTEYRPYGIIFHSGTDNHGHYFAAVKMEQSWYLCNDTQIKEIRENDIKNCLQKNASLIIASRMNNDSTV